MTPAARLTRQGLVSTWAAQLIQSLVLCGAVLVFLQMSGPLASADAGPEWRRYAIYAILLAGVPDPELRERLSRSLKIGGLLCDLPMAFGALQLFFGGETRWFVGATMVTIAIRLSYRPFDKGARKA